MNARFSVVRYGTKKFYLLYLLYHILPSHIEMGTRNTKTSCFVFRVSCFVYIDTNTRTPSRNTKQTRKKVETRKKHEKIEKFTCTPGSFKYYPFPLAFSPLAAIHIEILMLVSFNSISCYLLMCLYTIFSQTEFIL